VKEASDSTQRRRRNDTDLPEQTSRAWHQAHLPQDPSNTTKELTSVLWTKSRTAVVELYSAWRTLRQCTKLSRWHRKFCQQQSYSVRTTSVVGIYVRTRLSSPLTPIRGALETHVLKQSLTPQICPRVIALEWAAKAKENALLKAEKNHLEYGGGSISL
jgi:hypothetical protein